MARAPLPPGGVAVDDDAHDIVAHLAGVKAEVKREAHEHAQTAKLLLERHRSRSRRGGHAQIVELSSGITDTLVCLDDTQGQSAALSIEYGRPRQRGRSGYMDGLHVLGRTFGL